MPSTHLAALEASLALAASRAGDPAPQVYARLFARHPAMEAEFWRDTSGNVRGEMLARSFEALIDLAGGNAWGSQFIATERLNHAQYGIPPEIFADFLPIVADVIREACGPGFTDAMDAAWDAVLGEVQAPPALPA